MSAKTWTGAINSRWARWGNWSPGGKPGAGSDVVINSGAPVAAASIGTVHSITDSSQLYFESAGTNTVTTFLNNAGFLYVDGSGGEGGTILNIGGTLTNSDYLAIGNATLSASDKVTAGSLDNTGSIYLTGSAANQALLEVTGSAGFGAAGVLSGYVQLAGDSAVEFAGGQITSLSGSLLLNGSNAFVEDGSASSNNALTGLADIAGSLDLENKATVSTSGPLSNDGALQLDLFGGDGGSSLSVGGTPGATLNNANLLSLGNSSLSSSDLVKASSLVNSNSGTIDLTGSATAQALLDITTGIAGFGVAGNLTGTVDLAGDSAIEFATGQIARIATSSTLQLSGNSAFIVDFGATGSNSALTGLSNVAGALLLDHQASVATNGHLLDAGSIYLDYLSGSGGSTLSTGAGALAISASGLLVVGNGSLSDESTVTATALNNSGVIDLQGAGANQALINVTGGSAGFGLAGILTGAVSLTGNAAIEFVSGSINTIATGASLGLIGNNAYVEDSNTGLGLNSALTGLSTVSGSLDLGNGASVSVTGSLVNAGSIGVDSSGASGSSSLNIAGQLTNLGTLAVGSSSLTSADQATVAGLVNTGTIDVAGGTANLALLDIGAAAGFGAAGRVTGTVSLSGDSAIEFVSGQITAVAVGGALRLEGNSAFIEDGATNSNSALNLSTINGAFTLDDGAKVTTGSLTNNGLLELDAYVQGSGLSALSVATGLTNNGTLDIGSSRLSGSDKLTAASLANLGTINLTGNGKNLAALDVSGATTNNGAFSIATDTETLAGAVGGTAGSFSLSNANLQFNSSVALGQAINETGVDHLTLLHAENFNGTISGFGNSGNVGGNADTIDAANFLLSGTTFNFAGGILTLHDATSNLTANIHMTGVYSNLSFTLGSDGGTGTLVKFV